LDSQPALKDTIQSVIHGMQLEWSVLERWSERLQRGYARKDGHRNCWLVSGKFVDKLKQTRQIEGIAARYVLHRVAADLKQTSRFRSTLLDHLIAWMLLEATIQAPVQVWSESGLRVTWRKKQQQFQFQSLV
jgi:hypothetical protein